MRRWLAALLVACTAPAGAATFVATSVEESARASDAVVRGRVVSAESRLTRDGRGVVTEVEIAVDEAWKGAPDGTVKLTVPGGRVGRIAQRVDAAASFEPGEEVVVFLARRGETWWVMGHALGKYRVEAGEARSAVEGSQVLPRALSADERAVGTMSVVELERRVRGAR
jgi:hypothetical protein